MCKKESVKSQRKEVLDMVQCFLNVRTYVEDAVTEAGPPRMTMSIVKVLLTEKSDLLDILNKLKFLLRSASRSL
jgi:hypothetical protein